MASVWHVSIQGLGEILKLITNKLFTCPGNYLNIDLSLSAPK